jgi:hypothetical protein
VVRFAYWNYAACVRLADAFAAAAAELLRRVRHSAFP